MGEAGVALLSPSLVLPSSLAVAHCSHCVPLLPSLAGWAGAAEFRLCISHRYAGHACFVARVIFDSTAGVMSWKRCRHATVHDCLYCAPPT